MPGETLASMALWLTVFVGISQLLLGGLGVYVSLRPQRKEHHWLWICCFIAIGLLGVGLTGWLATENDRTQQQATADIHHAQSAANDANNAAIKANVAATNAAMAATNAETAATASQRETTLARNEAHKANVETQSLITGGDTYCYVLASPAGNEATLTVTTIGSSPLHEVMVERVDEDAMRKILVPGHPMNSPFDIDRFTYSYPSVPFLSPTSAHTIDKISLGEGNRRSLHFNFFSMNGVWGEDLAFARVNGVWVEAIRVIRHVVGYGIGGYGKGPFGGKTEQNTVYPWVDPSFPKVNGQVDW
jgi:hypothetical protein